MSLRSILTRPFYSVQTIPSRQQLQEDFGEFPPAPLRCVGPEGVVKIVRTCGIGQLYHDLLVHRAIVDAILVDPELLSSDLRAQAGVDMTKLEAAGQQLRRLPRFVLKIVGILLLLRYVSPVLVRQAIAAVRRRLSDSKRLGVFVPAFRNESTIVVKIGNHVERSDAPTVSHEHIHLLQHRNAEPHVRHARSIEAVIDEKMVSSAFLRYLLEKRELEARLHEVVLSFYRLQRKLPVTMAQFLGCLAASSFLGELLRLMLTNAKVPFEAYPQYDVRSQAFAQDLDSVFVFLRPELGFRFASEVLSVMYGNLLRYYGDAEAARAFHAQIERPNLYDTLYGVAG